MPDHNKKFHQFASESTLFKGRSDWYFCYLKAGRIMQVLFLLSEQGRHDDLENAARRSGHLAGDIAHLAAGELEIATVLADVFSLISGVQMLFGSGRLNKETAQLLQGEYETLAERLVRGSNPSPFVTAEDLSVPELPGNISLLGSQTFAKTASPMGFKDSSDKGQNKGQSNRMSLILDLVRKKKSLSIKEIAAVIKDCSEKTIQRELAALIAQGLVRKVGERRWSLYVPV